MQKDLSDINHQNQINQIVSSLTIAAPSAPSVRREVKCLPFASTFKFSYFYTFNGEKRRKTVEDNGTITKVDYCRPFVYETVSG